MSTTRELGRRFRELINNSDDAGRLLNVLDPRGELGVTEAKLNALISIRDTQLNRRFKSLRSIQSALGDDALFRRFRRELHQKPWESHPALLFPVRLETRFIGNVLRVRIYPDQVFIDTHDKDLTQFEYNAGIAYSKNVKVDPKSAWRKLSSFAGPRRAAWIRKCVAKHDFHAKPLRPKIWSRDPQMAPLPDRFWVFAYRNGQVKHKQMTAQVKSGRSLVSTLDPSNSGLFNKRSAWMHDFDEALADGFAVEIKLDQEDEAAGRHFEQIIAVGIRSVTPDQGAEFVERLIDTHHYTDGFKFVAKGTPTNNTDDEGAGHSTQDDAETAYDIEVVGPANWNQQATGGRKTNGHQLADALGVDAEKLKHVAYAGETGDWYAKDMNTITWRVTGDYYLRYLLKGILSPDQLEHVNDHVCNYMRGGGPLPSIQIGKQPYGVLPVTRVSGGDIVKGGWMPWTGDEVGGDASVFDAVLHRIVSQFFKKWLDRSADVESVPRVEPLDTADRPDPDETLLRILSMEPNSVTYRARPFLDERFVAWLLVVLRNHVFGQGSAYEQSRLSPLTWMMRWSQMWDGLKAKIDLLLTDLSSELQSGQPVTPRGEFLDKPLLRILSWGDGENELPPMVSDSDTPDALPISYLREFCENGTSMSGTLFAEIAGRALKLEWKSGTSIRDAICRLSAPGALEFFNSVTKAEEIVAVIEDDPNQLNAAPTAYGSRLGVANNILDERSRLGGRFDSLSQIDKVSGVGTDTFHDILYSFRKTENRPDIDRLFRESLDLASHRVDAWMTSFATKRLAGLRESNDTKEGVLIGAYGFVENLKPRSTLPSEGYFHTPSADQGAAAAVLYNAYLTHDPKQTGENQNDHRTANPFHINLTSHRVRHALRLLEGVRQGQPLGALLGFQFERALQEHRIPLEQYIDDFRELFPMVAHKDTPGESAETAAVAARTVVDGMALVRDVAAVETYFKKHFGSSAPSDEVMEAIKEVIGTISDNLDAVSDLLLTEGVYQGVRGNFERSGAALDAAAGNGQMPDLECVTTPVSGRRFGQRACLLLNDDSEIVPPRNDSLPIDELGIAEPRVANWFSSVLGEMISIGASFDFWEEETDSAVLARLNVNQADVDEISNKLSIDLALAEAIVDARGKEGRFKQLADLTRVNGIGLDIILRARSKATTGYVERVNVNTAKLPELEETLGQDLAEIIEGKRRDTLFVSIDDLTSIGISEEEIASIRKKVTTGRETITLADLAMSSTAFLYAAQTPPDGSGSEMDLRVARWVRDEFGLPPEQFVSVLADHSPKTEHTISDAIELARQTLGLLAEGTHLTPDALCHPASIEIAGYSNLDVDRLLERVRRAEETVLAIHAFNAELTSIQRIQDVSALNAEILTKLNEMAHIGIRGAVVRCSGDPELRARYEISHKEVERRIAGFNDVLREFESIGAANRKIELLASAMRALFGKSFIVLPTFEPHEASRIRTAFEQDILNGKGSERLRLWLQQVAGVSPKIAKLEDTIMIGDAWTQTERLGAEPPLTMSVAQLPYTDGRNWLGLSAEEGAERERQNEWPANPLSIVAVNHGSMPLLSSGQPVVIAGISVDYWDELIPDDQLSTSVAFQYDAPSAQAPQSLLLAVPSEVKSVPGVWTPESLAAIVSDTLDLAKVRTVDLDAISPSKSGIPSGDRIGAVLPGIYLPTNLKYPSWAGDVATSEIENWINILEATTEGCMTGTLKFPQLLADGGRTLEIAPHPDFELDIFARGIDHQKLNGARVVVRGAVTEISNRILIKDYSVIKTKGLPGFRGKAINRSGEVTWASTVETSALHLKDNTGVHTLQGGTVVEIGRLPKQLNQQVFINGNNYSVILRPTLAVSGRENGSDYWVDSYALSASGTLTIVTGRARSVIPVSTPVEIGVVQQGFEGHLFTAQNGGAFRLVGNYDQNSMDSLLGSKIWVMARINMNVGSGRNAVITSTGSSTTSARGPSIDVADFGLLREAGAVVDCGSK